MTCGLRVDDRRAVRQVLQYTVIRWIRPWNLYIVICIGQTARGVRHAVGTYGEDGAICAFACIDDQVYHPYVRHMERPEHAQSSDGMDLDRCGPGHLRRARQLVEETLRRAEVNMGALLRATRAVSGEERAHRMWLAFSVQNIAARNIVGCDEAHCVFEHKRACLGLVRDGYQVQRHRDRGT
ncbi:hypothetical protein BCR43DRAFT_319285 [Syncephalastrum racemosum]|uniref:Uncharacterized protein n=1 Tax=Syncephalastrum racemosum TaxID=13706 RepID=A0A1X2H7C8_SYNRA|nr:hypothetical protein BCR43DRAFT_319285 [Syncephalastrum racemosum]